ncbi:MAG: hypothetical protein HON94_00940 [Methylococcales bacterium]|nr:hypothetical protein [Methylococcales bacterium]
MQTNFKDNLNELLTVETEQLSANRKKLSYQLKKNKRLQKEIEFKQVRLKDSEEECGRKKELLKKAQQWELNDPSYSSQSVKNAYLQTLEDCKQLKQELERLKRDLNLVEQEDQHCRHDIEQNEEKLEQLQYRQREQNYLCLKQEIETVKTVTVREEASGDDNQTLGYVKQQAQKNTEISAMERFTTTRIKSISEVNMGELTQDISRYQLEAEIVSRRKIRKGWCGDNAYFYEAEFQIKGVAPSMDELMGEWILEGEEDTEDENLQSSIDFMYKNLINL